MRMKILCASSAAMMFFGGAVAPAQTDSNTVAGGATGAPEPARINPYSNPFKGKQEREDVFEFAAKPAVAKVGGKWVVTFASKGRCDATVSVVGPDGRTVRRLASGLLGTNAPWPFAQDSLSQSVEWDGRDDDGREAPEGCKFSVALGIRAAHDLDMPQSTFYAMAPGRGGGMACDPEGNLYIVNDHWTCVHMRAYDRDGNYLRTMWPPPANLPAERSVMIDWQDTTYGGKGVSRTRFGMYKWHLQGLRRQSPVITADGKFILITNHAGPASNRLFPRRIVLVDIRDGGVENSDIRDLGNQAQSYLYGDGYVFQVLSPDGKYLYLGGHDDGDFYRKQVLHAVSRVALTNTTKIELFAGEYNKPGNDDTHFSSPAGLAFDKDGNLYVADWGNDRIQILKPDGSLLKSIKINKPERVLVHQKSGLIYVMSVNPKPRKDTIFKIGGIDDPTVKASLDLPTHNLAFKGTASMCLDSSSNNPCLWVSSEGCREVGAFLWKLEDRGDKFATIVDGFKKGTQQKGWGGWDAGGHSYVVPDPYREELYVRLGDMCFPSQLLRVDGKTGNVIDRIALRVEQAYVGPDRLVYMRLEDSGEWLVKYDPDTKAFLPMTATAAKPVLQSVWGKKPGDHSGRKPLNYNGQNIIGVSYPAHPWGCTWQAIMGVAPNGDIYAPAGIYDARLADLKAAGLPTPSRGGDVGVASFSRDGTLKCLNILPGLRQISTAIRVGRGGSFYFLFMGQPIGRELPDGLKKGGRFDDGRELGTLIKLDSVTDKYPVGSLSGWARNTGWNTFPAKGKPTHMGVGEFSGSVHIEPVLWDYSGVGPLASHSCCCMNAIFHIDPYDRAFVPMPATCSVNVLDSNGNVMMRMGSYGNADSRGKNSSIPDPKTGLLRPRSSDDPADLKSPLPEIGFLNPRYVAATDEAVYTSDQFNNRITRVKLSYAAEELVAVK